MSYTTKIEWADATWNPVRGCTKVSPGCLNCYAETFAERFRGVKGHPFEQGFDVRMVPEALDTPLHWKKPRRVFVCSMSDLFHTDVPDEFIGRVWSRMLECPKHHFILCTKRAERMRDLVTRLVNDGKRKGLREATNILGMVTAENQEMWDRRVPILLDSPFALRGVSVEPMLGSVWMDLRKEMVGENALRCDKLHWIIFGDESGGNARPCEVDWIRDGVRQCKEAGVACFVKQLGSSAIHQHSYLGAMVKSYMDLKHPKGGDPSEWPEDLRVREFPNV